jgi:hypothetical protein
MGYISDTESEVFAKEIGALIREAGWQAKKEGLLVFGVVSGLGWTLMILNDPGKAPPYMGVLQEALSIAFGKIPIRSNKRLDTGDLWLMVGSKPIAE